MLTESEKGAQCLTTRFLYQSVYYTYVNKMPMLMLKCKTCGEVFPGLYVPEGSTDDFKTTATNSDITHICSRKHSNEYVPVDYMDWS
jgi:hypothetical protein